MPNNSFLRFCLVGLINTAVDLPVFVILHTAGLPIIIANVISTSLALVVSFTLHSRFTFRSRSLSAGRVVLYIAVTLIGLWLLQPLVISLVLALNGHLRLTSLAIDMLGHAEQVNSGFAKLASIAVTLAWNYCWYRWVIFRPANSAE